jgi:eukaryotic-like serine/threonine-protein kinase
MLLSVAIARKGNMKLRDDQLKALLSATNALFERPEAERAFWLEAQTGLDPEIHRRLQHAILSTVSTTRSTGSAMQWLQSGRLGDVFPRVADAHAQPARQLSIGEIVDRYRIVEWIGAGGMGEVWKAERDDDTVRRTVALKIPGARYLRRSFEARFMHERNVLAALTHPNIAALFDAGVSKTGMPYLAMEYIVGRTFIRYCNEEKCSVRSRLTLFKSVLQAVEHAHHQFIVHRDLKPSNVLVSSTGDVKLLDFGVAKILVMGRAEDHDLTRDAGVAVTANYASPNQLRSLPPSVQCDVYSLGVMLYETLAGARPYHLLAGSGIETLYESKIAPPSARVFDTEFVAQIAEPTALSLRKKLGGDLDAIVLKAIEFEAKNRYASVSDFSADLERILKNEPVLARPVGTLYTFKKFVQRHRRASLAVAAIFGSVLAGTTISLWQAQRAITEATRARAVEAFMLRVFDANAYAREDGANAIGNSAREILSNGVRMISADTTLQGQSRRDVLIALTNVSADLGDYARALRLGYEAFNISTAPETDAPLRLTLAHAALMRNDVAQLARNANVAVQFEPTLSASQALLRDVLRAYPLRHSDYPRAAQIAAQSLAEHASAASNDRYLGMALQRAFDVFSERDDVAAEKIAALIAGLATQRFGAEDPRTVEVRLQHLGVLSRVGQTARADAMVLDIKRIVVGETVPVSIAVGGWWVSAKRNSMDSPLLMSAAIAFAHHQARTSRPVIALYDAGVASTIAARLRTGADQTLSIKARTTHAQIALSTLRLDLAGIHTRAIAAYAAASSEPAASDAIAHDLRADYLTLSGDFLQAKQQLDSARAVRAARGELESPLSQSETALRHATVALGERDWSAALVALDLAHNTSQLLAQSYQAQMQVRIALLRATTQLNRASADDLIHAQRELDRVRTLAAQDAAAPASARRAESIAWALQSKLETLRGNPAAACRAVERSARGASLREHTFAGGRFFWAAFAKAARCSLNLADETMPQLDAGDALDTGGFPENAPLLDGRLIYAFL